MSAGRSVVMLTTGAAGSGKSYVRCARFMVDEFLMDEDGVHWSNFPLGLIPAEHSHPPTYEGETFRDRMAEAVAKRRKDQTAEQVKQRIQVIPPEEIERWLSFESGPWEFFADKDLSGSHIAIDEIHNFVPKGGKGCKGVQQRWLTWLGEIRHKGATVEFLTQHVDKLAVCLTNEAEIRVQLINNAMRREPFTGARMGDWYALRSGLFGWPFRVVVWMLEKRNIDGKWENQDARKFVLEPGYFRFYDSFSAPQKGGKAGKQARPHENKSKGKLLAWFVFRNGDGMVPRLLVAGVLVWLLAFGGIGRIMGALTSGLTRTATARMEEKQAEQDGEPWPADGDTAELELKAQVTPTVEVAAEAVAVDPEDMTRAGLVRMVEALTAELARQREQLERWEAGARQAQGITMITPEAIVMGDGERVELGEIFQRGPHLGRRLVVVNFKRKEVVLDDGTTLHLGGSVLGVARGGGLFGGGGPGG